MGAVWSFETYRKTEWLIGVTALEELSGLLAHDAGEVFAGFVFREVSALPGETVPGIELVGWHVLGLFPQVAFTGTGAIWLEGTVQDFFLRDGEAELADEAGAVARFLQEAGVAFIKLGTGYCLVARAFEVALVAGLELAQHNTGTAGHADGGGQKGVREKNTIRSQTIHVRGLDDGIAHAAHSIPSLVVRHHEDNVGFSHPQSPVL